MSLTALKSTALEPMKRYFLLILVSLFSLSGWSRAADPTDPGSNPFVDVQSVLLQPHLPPSDPSVKVRFNNAIDHPEAAKLSNYSLRQAAPELGAGTPGGTLEDLDGDGDLDMVIAVEDQIIAYQNVGSRSSPRYVKPYFVLAEVGYYDGLLLIKEKPMGAISLDVHVPKRNVAFGDVNGDGSRDMICSEAEDGQVTTFLRQNNNFMWPIFGQQKRTLQKPGQTLIEVSAEINGFHEDVSIASTVVSDIDLDGFPDLIIGDASAMWVQPQNIQVYRGTGEVDGDGSLIFNSPVSLKAGGNPIIMEMTIGYGAVCPIFHDMDGDGDLDLIVSLTGGQLWIFRASGRDANPNSDNYGFPIFGNGEQLKDVNGVEIDLGSLSALNICDYTGDGDIDLVVVSTGVNRLEQNRLRLLENLGGGGFRFSGQPIPIGVGGLEVELRTSVSSRPSYHDFDGDGHADILYAGSGYGLAISYNLDTGNTPHPRFSVPMVLPLSDEVVTLLAGGVPDIVDFDGDGHMDVNVDGVIVGTQADLVFMKFTGLLDDGLPGFGPPLSILPTGFSSLHLIQPTVGDLNGDGKLDVVVGVGTSLNQSGAMQLFVNSAVGQFQLAQPSSVMIGSSAVTSMFPELVDFDGDGDLDLLVTDRIFIGLAANKIRFLQNSGGIPTAWTDRGLIQDASGNPVSVSGDASVRVVDFNGDGKPDLLVSAASSSVTPFFGAGSGLGISVSAASPTLNAIATLPSSAALSEGNKTLELSFPMTVHAGGYLDLNELYVGGNRCAVLMQQIKPDPTLVDSDHDGVSDDWELRHFGSLSASDGTGNNDGDWLTDLEEFLLDLDPHFNDDSDMDGWIDGDESKWLVPDESNVTKLPSQLLPWGDEDEDGLANALESAWGTGPFSPGRPTDPAIEPAIRLTAAGYDGSGSNGRWENTGRLKGEFASVITKPLMATKPLVGNTGSKAAVEFQGGQMDWMTGPRVPSWLNGTGSRTVAAWVFNPAGGGTGDDDVLISWGDSQGTQQPRLFSCRYGPGTAGALNAGGNGGLNRSWGSYTPVSGAWSFVIYRYESKSGALVTMRDFQTGVLSRGNYLQTGIFASGGRPNAFVLGGDNDGSGGKTASAGTSLCIGDLWMWDRSVPLAEIISKAYEPLRVSYGKTTALADQDGDGLPDVLEVSLGLKPSNPNSDGDGVATGGGNDGDEFERGTNPLDIHNGRPHSVFISNGDHQIIFRGQETAPITYRVTDLEGRPIAGAPLEISVPAASAAAGKVRLNASGSPSGLSLNPVPSTNLDGEVSIFFKAD